MQACRRLFSLASLAPPHETGEIGHIEPGATVRQSPMEPGQGRSLLATPRQAAERVTNEMRCVGRSGSAQQELLRGHPRRIGGRAKRSR